MNARRAVLTLLVAIAAVTSSFVSASGQTKAPADGTMIVRAYYPDLATASKVFISFEAQIPETSPENGPNFHCDCAKTDRTSPQADKFGPGFKLPPIVGPGMIIAPKLNLMVKASLLTPRGFPWRLSSCPPDLFCSLDWRPSLFMS